MNVATKNVPASTWSAMMASRTMLPPASNFTGSTFRPYLVKESVSIATLVGTASTLACSPILMGARAAFEAGTACAAGALVAAGAAAGGATGAAGFGASVGFAGPAAGGACWQARTNNPALAPANLFRNARRLVESPSLTTLPSLSSTSRHARSPCSGARLSSASRHYGRQHQGTAASDRMQRLFQVSYQADVVDRGGARPEPWRSSVPRP